MRADASCPACEKIGLDVAFHIHKIPYFGEVMESVISCPSCGYRHADVVILEAREPVRYTLKVGSEEDMLIRVVRSGSARIEIPELGIKITPGLNSDGYISNVEGVLTRIEDVLTMIKSWEGGEKGERAEELLTRIKKIKAGKETARLIIEDPTGNSTIISDKAGKERA